MAWFQIAIYIVVLVVLAKPLGEYMAHVYDGDGGFAGRLFRPLERLVHRACGVRPGDDMGWKRYASCMLAFNLLGILVVYFLQRFQHVLPFNPAEMGLVSADSAFNTAVSFGTNTNWQGYGGETTMSHLTQMLALCVQNFVSAASGMAVLVAPIRGLTRRTSAAIGNFWVDLVRSTVYILLPLSLLFALFLVSQGVVQNMGAPVHAQLLQPFTGAEGKAVTEQLISVGPAASQIAIKQLGTNGGGFFNANSAHPLENPTVLSNFLEVLAILLIPAALCFTFGRMVKDRRQGLVLLGAMLIVLVPCLAITYACEQRGTPTETALGIDVKASDAQAGGNMEGKEVRNGIAQSAIWSVTTTAASNGSVNAMHDSFTPLGGLIPMWMIQLGEVIFGGVGSGLYGMLMFVIVAVFVAGLMIGRTPEYLGKKIGAFEMKMASVAILAPCMVVLLGTAVAVLVSAGKAGVANPGAHGFSEILYAFSSAANNNGSAFGGLSANTPFYNLALGFAMLCGRFLVKLPVLAIAGSLAQKKIVPASPGTLPTNDWLFIAMLVATVLLVGALTFIPGLALGPIVEHLQMLR
jgi:K+-transporting ATPase ATPase A chain